MCFRYRDTFTPIHRFAGVILKNTKTGELKGALSLIAFRPQKEEAQRAPALFGVVPALIRPANKSDSSARQESDAPT